MDAARDGDHHYPVESAASAIQEAFRNRTRKKSSIDVESPESKRLERKASNFASDFVNAQRRTLQEQMAGSPEKRRSTSPKKPLDAANAIQKAFRKRQSNKSIKSMGSSKDTDVDVTLAQKELALFDHIFHDESPRTNAEMSETSMPLEALFETLPYQPDNRRRRITGSELDEQKYTNETSPSPRRGNSKRRNTEGSKSVPKKPSNDPHDSAATKIQEAFRNKRAEKHQSLGVAEHFMQESEQSSILEGALQQPLRRRQQPNRRHTDGSSRRVSKMYESAASKIQHAFRKKKKNDDPSSDTPKDEDDEDAFTQKSCPVSTTQQAIRRPRPSKRRNTEGSRQPSKKPGEEELQDTAAARIQKAFQNRKSARKATTGHQGGDSACQSLDATKRDTTAATAIQHAFRKKRRRHTQPARTEDEKAQKGGALSLVDSGGGPSNTSNRARERAERLAAEEAAGPVHTIRPAPVRSSQLDADIAQESPTCGQGQHRHRPRRLRTSDEKKRDEATALLQRSYNEEQHAAAMRIQRCVRRRSPKQTEGSPVHTDGSDIEEESTSPTSTKDSSPRVARSTSQSLAPQQARSFSQPSPPKLASVKTAPSLEELWPYAPQSRGSVQVPGYEMAMRCQRRISAAFGGPAPALGELSSTEQLSRRTSAKPELQVYGEASPKLQVYGESSPNVLSPAPPDDDGLRNSSRPSSRRRGQPLKPKLSTTWTETGENGTSRASSPKSPRQPSGALVAATHAAGKDVEKTPPGLLELSALQPCLRKTLMQRITLPPVKDTPRELKRRPVPSGMQYRMIRSLPGPASNVMQRLAEHWRDFKVVQIAELRMSKIAQRKMDPITVVAGQDSRFSRNDDGKDSSKLADPAIISPTEASLCCTTVRQGTLPAPPPAFSRGGPAGSFRQCWMSQGHRY